MKISLRSILFLTAAALSITPAFADLLIYEPFNYSPGSAILGQTDIVTSASEIWVQAGTAATTVHQAAAGSLSGPLGTSEGNKADLKGVDNSEYGRMTLGSVYNADTIPNYTLFYSLLLNVPDTAGLTVAHTNPNCNNDGLIAFNNNTGGGARPNVWSGELVIRLGSVAGTFNLGVRASGTAAGTTYFSGDLTPGQTYLVVVEYAAGSSAAALAQNFLWINPDSSTFGAATAPLPTGETDGTPGMNHADSVILGAGIAAGACPNDTYVDELRVATTWADVTSTTLPVAIRTQPSNTRALIGGQATFSVSTRFADTFQWQHNGSPVANGTTSSLAFTNVQASDAGTYKVVVGVGTPTLASSDATLTVFPDIYPRLAPLWSIAPGSRPYLTVDAANAPTQRGIAYNVLSNTVLLVSRTNYVTGSTDPAIYALNGDTGADVNAMNTSGISGGCSLGGSTASLNYIDVAADGAVVASNIGSNITGGDVMLKLWYWANADPATPPVMVYNGDPSGQQGVFSVRFGDYFAVRGAGDNMQVMLDSQSGTWGAVLAPSPGHVGDGTPWIPAYFNNVAGGTTGGRTLLYYGTDATFWEKHGGQGTFNLLSYDTSAHTSTSLLSIPNINGAGGQFAFNSTTNVLVATVASSSSSAPDALDQYDLTDPTQPLFVKRYYFPVNHNDNNNGCGRVIFSGDRVYALDSNNGLAAWTLVPVLYTTLSGPDIILSWPASTPGYTLRSTPSLTPPVTWANVGTGTLVGNQYFVTNAASSASLFYRLQK